MLLYILEVYGKIFLRLNQQKWEQGIKLKKYIKNTFEDRQNYKKK